MTPYSSNPPALPPSVEEAYRRKCIQLKARFKEVERTNDGYRVRLARLQRQIQKVRLERAMLLEQILKRTSTNVADSDGSPSPPPSVRKDPTGISHALTNTGQPQDKPLRAKRSHRKPSYTGGDMEPAMTTTFINQSGRMHSPASETFSYAAEHYQHGQHGNGGYNAHRSDSHGRAKAPKRPSNAFEIYSNECRPILQDKYKDRIAQGKYMLEDELARRWRELDDEGIKAEYQARYEQKLSEWKEEREASRRAKSAPGAQCPHGDGGRGRGRDSSRGRDPAASASAADADERESERDRYYRDRYPAHSLSPAPHYGAHGMQGSDATHAGHSTPVAQPSSHLHQTYQSGRHGRDVDMTNNDDTDPETEAEDQM